MRIHAPKPTIDPTAPFKEALYGRQAFAESLTTLLRNISEGLVIFVHAPWGEGKTTFAKMWQADLARQQLSTIYFDAFAADYVVDPFVCFSGEILHLAEKQLPAEKGLKERREFKKVAVEVGKRLAGLTAKIALKSATLGALDSTHVEELKQIGSEICTDVAKIGADTIEQKIENYAAEKDSLAAFKKSLSKLAELVRQRQSFPLTIIVDELDRCRPDFALTLLERVKHLFDVEGVAFVLLVNRDQIESYINAVYGDVDARAYLLKFANIFVELPNNEYASQVRYEPGRQQYCQTLFKHHELGRNVQDGRFLARCLESLVEHFKLTLREIERVFASLSLYYSSSTKGSFTNEFLVSLLSILKVKNPSLYAQLKTSQIQLPDFLQATNLQTIRTRNDGLDPEWAKKFLQFCLMTEAEYEKALKAEEQRDHAPPSLSDFANCFRMQRPRIIPYICDHLDCFALKP